MRTSGLFTTHSYPIRCKSSEQFHLVFFGDVHRDSPNHAKEEWQEFLRYAKSLPESTRFIGMGDYLDATSTSERIALGNIVDQMHETLGQKLQRLHMEDVEQFADELSFMRGRIVGMLNGNHYFSFSDGTNTDQQLCRLLGCQYLGVSSFVRLYLKVTKTNCHSFDLWLHHGTGAGRLLGGSINRVDQMREFADADVYGMGDDHARLVVPAQPRFRLECSARGGLEMKQRPAWLLRSGSFLKGYVPGKSSYIVDSARGPRSLGHVELLLTPVCSAADFRLEVRTMS